MSNEETALEVLEHVLLQLQQRNVASVALKNSMNYVLYLKTISGSQNAKKAGMQ